MSPWPNSLRDWRRQEREADDTGAAALAQKFRARLARDEIIRRDLSTAWLAAVLITDAACMAWLFALALV